MARCWGAAGFMSDAAYKKMNQLMRADRKAAAARERDKIAALSNQDIQKIMARVIRTRAADCGSVTRQDFLQAGIPEHRIDKNRDAAFRLARQQEPKLDAMGSAPCAA